MNVLDSRTCNDVIILGSGSSILELNREEINYINNCKVVIALNKFMIFYKKSKILPTHIFFINFHETSFDTLNYLFKVCEKDKLEHLTFIVNKLLKPRLYYNFAQIPFLWLKYNYKYFKAFIEGRIRRSFFKVIEFPKFIKPSKGSKLIFTNHTDFMIGGQWAENLSQTLYHYRGSISSALNYASIIAPGQNIYLIGTDFNSSNCFFDDDLEKSNIPYKDWTFEMMKKQNNHWSVIDYKGTTIYDKLPFMLEKLNETGNTVFCNNPKSGLVTNGYIKYKDLLPKR